MRAQARFGSVVYGIRSALTAAISSTTRRVNKLGEIGVNILNFSTFFPNRLVSTRTIAALLENTKIPIHAHRLVARTAVCL